MCLESRAKDERKGRGELFLCAGAKEKKKESAGLVERAKSSAESAVEGRARERAQKDVRERISA